MARRRPSTRAAQAGAIAAAIIGAQARCGSTILASQILGRSLLGERSPRLRCDLAPGHDGPHLVTVGETEHRW